MKFVIVMLFCSSLLFAVKLDLEFGLGANQSRADFTFLTTYQSWALMQNPSEFSNPSDYNVSQTKNLTTFSFYSSLYLNESNRFRLSANFVPTFELHSSLSVISFGEPPVILDTKEFNYANIALDYSIIRNGIFLSVGGRLNYITNPSSELTIIHPDDVMFEAEDPFYPGEPSSDGKTLVYNSIKTDYFISMILGIGYNYSFNNFNIGIQYTTDLLLDNNSDILILNSQHSISLNLGYLINITDD